MLVFLGLAMPAFGQTCSLCINSVAASKSVFIAGLRHGIFILMIPPLVICLSIGVAAYRRNEQYRESLIDESVE